MKNEEIYDLDAMADELDAEQYIGEEVLSAGHACILPLANTIGMEDSDMFSPEEFIRMDIAIMESIKPERAVIVLRKGWPQSDGANREMIAAQRLGWRMIDLGMVNVDEFREALAELGSIGCFTCYVAGPYRHYLPDIGEI